MDSTSVAVSLGRAIQHEKTLLSLLALGENLAPYQDIPSTFTEPPPEE